MSSRNPFSIVLPEGGRVAVQKWGTVAAFREACDINRSRDARGLPLVRLLHRPSGRLLDVPPDADVLARADAWDEFAPLLANGGAA